MTLKSKSVYLNYLVCQISINHEHFNFVTNLCLTKSENLVKLIFNIKIEIEIFEISNVSNLNNF